jgi:nucleoside-diphosphate-sugar epimerase
MLDVSRAREAFGWTARVPFAEGVGRTVEWWLAEGRS